MLQYVWVVTEELKSEFYTEVLAVFSNGKAAAKFATLASQDYIRYVDKFPIFKSSKVLEIIK